MWRILRVLILVLFLGGITGAVVWSFMPQPVGVDLAVVARGDLEVTVEDDGKTRIRERYLISAPLAGRMLRVEHDPGDAVVAGKTTLTTIVPRPPELLDARTRAQAVARVQAAEATWQRTEPLVEQARAAQDYAEEELSRARRLHSTGGVTESELNQAVLTARLKTEEFRAARLAGEIAQFELEQARSALIHSRPAGGSGKLYDSLPTEASGSFSPSEQEGGSGKSSKGTPANAEEASAEPVIAETPPVFSVKSPIDGEVLRVFQESAAVVTAGTSILEVGNPGDLEIVVDVLSQDAVRIKPGDEARLLHWGGENPIQAYVRTVEPAAFDHISTLGVEEQRVNVVLDLEDVKQAERLGDGFRVEASIVVWKGTEILKIPTSAMFRHEGGWAVFRVESGLARIRPVEIGRQNGLEAQVFEGLAAGDQVVIHASDAVNDGVRVEERQ